MKLFLFGAICILVFLPIISGIVDLISTGIEYLGNRIRAANHLLEYNLNAEIESTLKKDKIGFKTEEEEDVEEAHD